MSAAAAPIAPSREPIPPASILAVILGIASGFGLAFGGIAGALLAPVAVAGSLLLLRPMTAYCLLVFSIAFESVSALSQAEVFTLSAVKVVGALAAASLLLFTASGARRLRIDAHAVLGALFFGAVLASVVSSVNLAESARATLTIVQLFVLWAATRVVIDTHKKLCIAGGVAAVSLAVSACFSIAEYIANPRERVVGISQNAALLSADLFVAIGFAGVWLCRARSASAKLCWAAVLGISVIGMMVTLSRAAYIAFVPALMVAGFVWGGWRSLFRFVVLGSLFALFTVPFLFHRATGFQDTSTSGHMMTLNAGLQMVEDHPLLGVGIGNFGEYYLQYSNDERQLAKTGHNTWLNIAAEIGLPGLFAFALFHLAAGLNIFRAGKALRGHDPCHRAEAAAIAFALVAFVVMGFMHSLHVAKYLWIVLAAAAQPVAFWVNGDLPVAERE